MDTQQLFLLIHNHSGYWITINILKSYVLYVDIIWAKSNDGTFSAVTFHLSCWGLLQTGQLFILQLLSSLFCQIFANLPVYLSNPIHVSQIHRCQTFTAVTFHVNRQCQLQNVHTSVLQFMWIFCQNSPHLLAGPLKF